MSELTSTDRAWFKRNRATNLRVRRPADGELERIFSKSLGSHFAIDCSPIPALDGGYEWRVLVVKIDHETLARLPISQMQGTPFEVQGDGSGTGALMCAIGGNIVLDKIRA
ncbi:MAG: hypothetical protein ACR652_00805 [Methylocystis sp.]|uniref:hypothetical protein n=1 Tax=Methylocystis sp. TaxID=1911079 RepID=UPI003DA2DC0F